LRQRWIQLAARNRGKAEPRKEMTGGGREQVDVANPAVARELERRLGQPFAPPLAAVLDLDRHRPQQSGLAVHFHGCTSQESLGIARNQSGLDVVLDSGDRERRRLEQRHDVGQITRCCSDDVH